MTATTVEARRLSESRERATLWKEVGTVPQRASVGDGPRGLQRPGRRLALLVLFYEYFHGDNGAGIGASHQTMGAGTGVVARIMHMFSTTTAEQVLALGQRASIVIETESAWGLTLGARS